MRSAGYHVYGSFLPCQCQLKHYLQLFSHDLDLRWILSKKLSGCAIHVNNQSDTHSVRVDRFLSGCAIHVNNQSDTHSVRVDRFLPDGGKNGFAMEKTVLAKIVFVGINSFGRQKHFLTGIFFFLIFSGAINHFMCAYLCLVFYLVTRNAIKLTYGDAKFQKFLAMKPRTTLHGKAASIVAFISLLEPLIC